MIGSSHVKGLGAVGGVRGVSRLRFGLSVVLAVLIVAPAACGRTRTREPVTVVLLDIGPARNREYSEWTAQALEGFTRETGIAVKRLLGPFPEQITGGSLQTEYRARPC